jgi:glycosyltransferase involved in cell wall biosynthesis
MPLVSIIVPVYNVEPYLRRCLDSLVNQTLKNIEIICINDCSPDNSLIMLKEYAKKDKRVKVIANEENLGECGSRNLGNKLAKGDYIGAIDPDDYVDLDYYEKLYAKAKKTNADVVYANLKQKQINNVKEYIHTIKKTGKIYSISSHCLAIYKVELLQKYSITYPEGIKLSGDIAFLVKALFFANKIESVNDVFYHYINRKDSASGYIGNNIHESYGMPLVFDFINKTLIDKEEYGHFFGHFFGHLLYLFPRIVPEWKYVFIQDVVEIYRNRKYPVVLENIPKFLKESDLENADILFEKLNDNLDFLQYPKIEINNLQNRKLYIWGAGANGLDALIQCDNNSWHIEAFLDSNQNIKEFQEYRVLHPQSLLNSASKDFFIVISSRDYASEIAKICEQAGLKERKDFWRPS